jgi:hypothetical protein
MPLLIDKYIEQYQYSARYEKNINASAKDCFLAAKHLDISPSLVTRLLLRLRGLPYKNASLQDFIKNMCFTYKEEDPYNEFIIDASQKGMKIYWNFYFKEISPTQTIVGTETRIYCLTLKTKRKFSLYWFFVKPFSGLIRKEILRMIEKKVGSKFI